MYLRRCQPRRCQKASRSSAWANACEDVSPSGGVNPSESEARGSYSTKLQMKPDGTFGAVWCRTRSRRNLSQPREQSIRLPLRSSKSVLMSWRSLLRRLHSRRHEGRPRDAELPNWLTTNVAEA